MESKQYKIWLEETPLENPIVISVCAIHYDEMSFVERIEAQEIVGVNTDCSVCFDERKTHHFFNKVLSQENPPV